MLFSNYCSAWLDQTPTWNNINSNIIIVYSERQGIIIKKMKMIPYELRKNSSIIL